MKKYISILLTIFLCLMVYGCEKTKVTFNYNCPGASIYKCDVVDKKINCTFTMPTCGDKEFIGWYDKPVNGTRVNLDKDFTESTTLYAYWNDKETEKPVEEPEPDIETYYNLVFNANGGSGGESDKYQIESGSKLPEISKEKPTRDGYTFMGWYDNSDYTKGTQYYDENCNRILSFDKESDLILYAGWKESSTYEEPEPIDEEYMITFNSNGGYGGQSGYEYATYGKAMPTIEKTKPTRTGYEFMGWYDNSDYTKGTRYYDSNCSSVRTYNKKSGITLYAGWNIKTYTITFNANGGSGGQSGTLSTTYNAILPAISKAIPSKTGYTFKGWYDNSDYTKGTQYYNEKNEAVRVFNKTSNITLYAGWSKIVTVFKYTVKFNINNGIGTTPSDVTAILGNAMPAITSSIPTKSGYTFMGWYDNANYLNGTQYYTNQNKSARAYDRMSGITLYAGWKDNSYTVSFSPNGGSGGQVNSVNVKYGANMPTISTVIPVRDGYTFMGWYDNTDYTKGTQYYTAKCASARTYNKASNTTLYAGWKKITYLEPIKPKSGENVVKSEETDTLKVYITKGSSYYLTRVWAKDPYTQLNKQNASPYGKTLTRPGKLLEAAISEKNMSNKLIVGFNASGFYKKGTYDPRSVEHYPPYNLTSVGTIVITDGKVIRNVYDIGDVETWFITGVTKDNKMVIFEDKKYKLTSTTEKKAWSESVIASGIRNTYTFAAPIILEGKKTSYTNKNSRMPASNDTKKGLQLFCQVNKNNFVFFTASNETRNKGINLLLDLGCQTAVNLDGGGSIALLFKPSNSTSIQAVIGNGRSLPEVGYFSQ